MSPKNEDVSRRDFVKTAGAATAAVVAVPRIQKVKAANDQVQYGFIGTGSRGQYLLKHINETDRGHCVAVCDVYEPNLKAGAELARTNPKTFQDYRELLSQKDVDCVFIAVPLFLHFPVTRDGLLAGKHVFCEKSLVFKPEEVHALRELAAEHPKQILQVGLQRRYSHYYQTARQMIEKGHPGQGDQRPGAVASQYVQQGSVEQADTGGDDRQDQELAQVPRIFRRVDGRAGLAPDRRGGLDVRRAAGDGDGDRRPGLCA